MELHNDNCDHIFEKTREFIWKIQSTLLATVSHLRLEAIRNYRQTRENPAIYDVYFRDSDAAMLAFFNSVAIERLLRLTICRSSYKKVEVSALMQIIHNYAYSTGFVSTEKICEAFRTYVGIHNLQLDPEDEFTIISPEKLNPRF